MSHDGVIQATKFTQAASLAQQQAINPTFHATTEYYPPDYSPKIQAQIEKEKELESLLEEIRIAVISYGALYFKEHKVDLTARQAFNSMVNGYHNQKENMQDRWREIESFKLK